MIDKYSSYSFAFDGVISDDFDGTINEKKGKIQKLICDLLAKGKLIYIFTKRYSQNEVEYPNKKLKKILTEVNAQEWQEVQSVCKSLNIPYDNVLWTSRGTYYQYLGNSQTHCHFDSSEYEIVLMNNFIPSVKTININSDNWETNDN